MKPLPGLPLGEFWLEPVHTCSFIGCRPANTRLIGLTKVVFFNGATGYPQAGSRKKELARLQARLDRYKWQKLKEQEFQGVETADGEVRAASLDRKAYLRGPAGERDRLTIWKAARGTLPGTGEGGLKEGWLDDAK